MMWQVFQMIKDFNKWDLIHRDIKMKNFVVNSALNYPDVQQPECIDQKIELKLVDFDFVDFYKEQKHSTYIGTRP